MTLTVIVQMGAVRQRESTLIENDHRRIRVIERPQNLRKVKFLAEALIVEQRAAPLLGRVDGQSEGSRSQEDRQKEKKKKEGKKRGGGKKQ